MSLVRNKIELCELPAVSGRCNAMGRLNNSVRGQFPNVNGPDCGFAYVGVRGEGFLPPPSFLELITLNPQALFVGCWHHACN